MAYPLLPLFVTGVLGAGGSDLGAIEGAGALLVAILTGWAGWKSDRDRTGGQRRVLFVRWGYGLPVIGKTLIAGALAWPMVLAGRSIDRIGKGLRGAPRDALIADATGPDDRGRAFGFHRAMDTGGALAGVLASAAILWWMGSDESEAVHGGIRLVLFVAAGVGMVSLVFTFLVREPARKSASTEPAQGEGIDAAEDHAGELRPAAAQGRSSGLGPRYWWTLVPLLLFAIANSSDAFILLRAADVGLSPVSVVLAYALYNLTYTLGSYPAGVIGDRVGMWRMIAGGWAVYIASYVGFALTRGWEIWGLMALYGVYAAMTDGAGKALVANIAPVGRRGTALGVYSMSVGLATLLASVAAGVMWDRVSHAAPFWLGAGMGVLAAGSIPLSLLAIRRAGR